MKRKIAVMCVLALTGTMMLTACGNKKDSNNGKTSDGKTAIRFATWDVADDVDAQQKLVDKFNEEHDDIEVTLEAYGSDFDTKISAGMGSGDTPDVMYMWNYPATKASSIRLISTAHWGISTHLSLQDIVFQGDLQHIHFSITKIFLHRLV